MTTLSKVKIHLRITSLFGKQALRQDDARLERLLVGAEHMIGLGPHEVVYVDRLHAFPA